MITKEDLIKEGFIEDGSKYQYNISDKKILTIYVDVDYYLKTKIDKFCIEILPYTQVNINSIEEVKFILNMCKNE